MLVYRLCKEEEIKEILRNKKFINVGKCYKVNSGISTHKYIDGKKYLHFFDKKSDTLYLKTIKGNYICAYDIPFELLDKYQGTGFYLDRSNYRLLEEVNEYAIPCNYLSFDYLLRVQRIDDDIDFDDYLYDGFDNMVTTIYEKEIKNKHTKGRLVLIRRRKNN